MLIDVRSSSILVSLAYIHAIAINIKLVLHKLIGLLNSICKIILWKGKWAMVEGILVWKSG